MGLDALTLAATILTVVVIDDGCGSVEVSCVGWIYPANA
jgi:hypothetical protein